MKILVVFPTRSRPTKFWSTLQAAMQMAKHPEKILWRIVYDDNDPTMNNDAMRSKLTGIEGMSYIGGQSLSKIHAVNRTMTGMTSINWDIGVLLSDDMICQQTGWDELLRIEMQNNFPDTDGVLFHWDGDPATKRHNNGNGLNTMCIFGREYYKRFGYIYHPEYTSLWCDNEFTDVADELGRQFRSDHVLFKHVHHSNTPGMQPDKLMQHTQTFYSADEKVYNKRKALGFPR